jgi:hypothetical protein
MSQYAVKSAEAVAPGVGTGVGDGVGSAGVGSGVGGAGVQAYCAKTPYEQPSIVTLAHPPVPSDLNKSAAPLLQTDVLTDTCDGHVRGSELEHHPKLWSSP